MEEQIDTQKQIRANNSLLGIDGQTLDEGLKIRKIIDIDEQFLDHLNHTLLTLAEQGFGGYNHPGSLTTFFYGYAATPPTQYAPGTYARAHK